MSRREISCILKMTARIFIILLVSNSAFGQKKYEGIEDKLLKNKLKIADQLYSSHSYYNAISFYDEIHGSLKENEYALFKLGMSYFKARDYQNAEKYLTLLIEKKKEKTSFPIAIFHLGETLKMNGKYDEAKKVFLMYLRSKGNSKEDRFLRSITKNEIASCEFAKNLISFDTLNYVKVDLLEGEVNNPYSDFSPFLSNKDTLIFASLRSDSVIKVVNKSDEAHPVQLYQSTRGNDNIWSKPTLYKPYVHPYQHTANGVYSPDKKHFYFTRCKPDKNAEVVCAIYSSELKEGKWTKAKKMKYGINKKHYTSTQPSVAVMEKVVAKKKREFQVLYFVSNRPGGRGLQDIWYSMVNDKGVFSKPVNCGNKINTVRDEITPFCDNEKKVLFFSSNYHLNAGGFDVFKTSGSLKKWEKPENLGLKVNSSYDDTYYTAPGNLPGFVVSNRPGGKALKSETCCDDIYKVEYITPVLQTVKGSIKPELAENNLQNVKVGILPTKRLANHMKWHKSIENLQDSIQWIANSDSLNSFSFQTTKTKNYSVIFVKDSFEVAAISLDSLILYNKLEKPFEITLKESQDTSKSKIFNNHLPTVSAPPKDDLPKSLAASSKAEINTGDVFILDNMYFDTDKDLIKDEALPALELLMKFLTANPLAVVEIAGHTDSHADEEHNLDLSQRRANRILSYVVKKGIDKKRVTARGYGEDYPIAPNENEDGSDNPEGRKKNRRTEVRILGQLESGK